jgi:hypothetical protein
MAITNYANLQTAILYRLGNRSNATLTAKVPEFIASWEAAMNRRLKTADMEATATLTTTINQSSVALPTGFTQMRRLRLRQGDSAPFNFTDIWPVPLAGDKIEYGSGSPVGVSIQGSNLIVKPTPNDAYTLIMDYYARFTQLSDDNMTNWILTNNPDAYELGGTAYGYLSTGGLDRYRDWVALAFAVIEEINEYDEELRFVNIKARTDVTSLISQQGSYNIRSDNP